MSDHTEDIIKKSNKELQKSTEKPLSIYEFIDELIKNPNICIPSHEYLVNAIEYFGMREVIENGDKLDRYVFFDDPKNDNEHAVFGNTKLLNKFVDDLKSIAYSKERMQKIFLFNGPTATGKSELKRCIINGLKEYSKTEEGKRYTIEWNISSLENSQSKIGYNNSKKVKESEWFESPAQINPISVFPKSIRKEINNKTNSNLPVNIELDPFSQESYNILKNYYNKKSTDNIFEKIVSEDHLRIKRYTMDNTKGIGVLNIEDDGSVKERLLGSWIPSLFKELDSRGRKNPQAFNYDGILMQGNGGVTFVEEASAQVDILLHMLNIPDESYAKIDKQIGIDTDTVPIFISNPDLIDQKLEKNLTNVDMKNIHGSDSLKALKRRLLKYKFRYLTSLKLESKLLYSELVGEKPKWENHKDYYKPLTMNNTEFAPHTLEAAAMYNVITRLTEPEEDNISVIDKAIIYDETKIENNNQEITIDDIKINGEDGSFGIPVTYTRDKIKNLIYKNDTNIYLPFDILDILEEELDGTAVFIEKEKENFRLKVNNVKEYIHEKQKEDVLEAILKDRKATKEQITEYIDNVYKWEENSKDYDRLKLKLFEIKYLGMNEDDYKNNNAPKSDVKKFRLERIINPLNNSVWNNKDKDFEISDSISNIPILKSLLYNYKWKDMFREYEDINPLEWDEPSNNTITKEVKAKCIKNMMELYGYSEESAKRTCERVFEREREKLLNIK